MKPSNSSGLGEKTMVRFGSKMIKHLATIALMAAIGVTTAYAGDISVKMTYSGTNAASTINLQQFRRRRYVGSLYRSQHSGDE
jgi:hypothetical protein